MPLICACNPSCPQTKLLDSCYATEQYIDFSHATPLQTRLVQDSNLLNVKQNQIHIPLNSYTKSVLASMIAKPEKKNLKENLYFNFIEHKSKYVCSSDGWSQCKFVLCLFLLLRALGKGPDQGMAKTGICPATASSHDWSHWLRTCWSVQCDWSSCLAIE